MLIEERVCLILQQLVPQTQTYQAVEEHLETSTLLAEKLQGVGTNEEVYKGLAREISGAVNASPALVCICLKVIRADGDNDLFYTEANRSISWGTLSVEEREEPWGDGLGDRHPLFEVFEYELKSHTFEELYSEPVQDAQSWLEEEMHQELQKLKTKKVKEAGVLPELPSGVYHEDELEQLKELMRVYDEKMEEQRRHTVITAEELIEAIVARIGRKSARRKYLSVDTHLVDSDAWKLAYKEHFAARSLNKEKGKRKELVESLLAQRAASRDYLYVTSGVNDKMLNSIEDYFDRVQKFNASKASLESQGLKVDRGSVHLEMLDNSPEISDIEMSTIYRAESAVNSLLDNLEKGIFPGSFSPK